MIRSLILALFLSGAPTLSTMTLATQGAAPLSGVTDFPMVTLTEHPLVALYASPPCQAGRWMRILTNPP